MNFGKEAFHANSEDPAVVAKPEALETDFPPAFDVAPDPLDEVSDIEQKNYLSKISQYIIAIYKYSYMAQRVPFESNKQKTNL